MPELRCDQCRSRYRARPDRALPRVCPKCGGALDAVGQESVDSAASQPERSLNRKRSKKRAEAEASEAGRELVQYALSVIPGIVIGLLTVVIFDQFMTAANTAAGRNRWMAMPCAMIFANLMIAPSLGKWDWFFRIYEETADTERYWGRPAARWGFGICGIGIAIAAIFGVYMPLKG